MEEEFKRRPPSSEEVLEGIGDRYVVACQDGLDSLIRQLALHLGHLVSIPSGGEVPQAKTLRYVHGCLTSLREDLKRGE